MTASVPPISDPSAGATPSAIRIARASALIPHGWALRTCAADKRLRAAFPDFHPEIHWQAAAGNLVTTYKTYHGTHQRSEERRVGKGGENQTNTNQKYT